MEYLKLQDIPEIATKMQEVYIFLDLRERHRINLEDFLWGIPDFLGGKEQPVERYVPFGPCWSIVSFVAPVSPIDPMLVNLEQFLTWLELQLQTWFVMLI
jgi:hypothetical protein